MNSILRRNDGALCGTQALFSKKIMRNAECLEPIAKSVMLLALAFIALAYLSYQCNHISFKHFAYSASFNLTVITLAAHVYFTIQTGNEQHRQMQLEHLLNKFSTININNPQ